MKYLGSLFLFIITFNVQAQIDLNQEFKNIEPKLIEWRRYLHEHPELSNREFQTAEFIANHLSELGLEVQTGIGKTGVVGILKGELPGKVIALRADIDALPVTERTDLTFKSTVETEFLGTKTGVMHACGHDAHTSMLMGVAEILSKHKEHIKGTIKFIFQPAEEGPPPGEEGGAKLMIKEGVLDQPKVDAIFGLHIATWEPTGTLAYKTKGLMAANERFEIKIKGKQTHGSTPWTGVDPILIATKLIDAFQTIISRESELTNEAAVISVGKINSGVRYNIIPETAELTGTIRTLDPKMKTHILKRMTELTEAIASAYGGEASIEFFNTSAITYNDPDLVQKMLPSLSKVVGESNVTLSKAITGAEDFSYFQEVIPGFYFFLGGQPNDKSKIFPHHTPDFMINEDALIIGVKTLTQLSLDYLNQ
jgi:amidohydrolase